MSNQNMQQFEDQKIMGTVEEQTFWAHHFDPQTCQL